MYLLECVGMDVFHVLMLWSVSWLGGAVLSNRLGLWAERFGQRPLLVWSVAFKSVNMIALVFTPHDPHTAFWTLLPVFMFDAFLNAGYNIATNAYLLKHSPPQNRTTFIAAGAGLAGIAGGATSILAGVLLSWSAGWRGEWWGATWVNFEVMFAISVLLRISAIGMALRVREPGSVGALAAMGLLAREAKLAAARRIWTRVDPAPAPGEPELVGPAASRRRAA